MIKDLSQEAAMALLEQSIYGHLGCHASGKTYVIPISYAFDGHYIYCHTTEGLKMEIMRQNPHVCFQVQSVDTLGGWKSVIVQGIFEELQGANRQKGIEVLLHRKIPAVVTETIKLSSDWPFSDPASIELPGVVFSISIGEVSGRSEKAPSQNR